ncbi:hypothetical protein [Methylobacterium planeticum]|uniref:Uncharacterized protein n=1 Tax=Methylobacterium planeticum TaxID=2615211 RepID=A0A6N6MES5_9HYPH|nr:hypothetical protein [Methylobacterium planeticum]KAB1069277.1 hypothetical protein F6X51_25735 [Methylobacterium planeticum]
MLIPALAFAAFALILLVGGGLLALRGQTDGERDAGAVTALIALLLGLIAVALGLCEFAGR